MSPRILSRSESGISEATMLLHAIIPASRANGPGLRAVVFFQGCTLGCKKCFNPTTHVFQGAEVAPEKVAEALVEAHREHILEGVTFSGGEPMQQADSLLTLMRNLRSRAPRPNGCARRSRSSTRYRKGGCCSLRPVTRLRACRRSYAVALRWARSSSTCPRPSSVRRSGGST